MRKATLLFLTVLLAAGSAAAQEQPRRKSGQWELTRTTTLTEDKPVTVHLCVDEAKDNALLQVAEGMRFESCKADKLSRNADKLVVDATCQLQRSSSKTHAVVTGKFDSAYKIESKSTYNPPLRGAEQGHAVLEAKWTGPCPADQRPGDLILGGGRKVNIFDDAQTLKDRAGAKEKGSVPGPTRPPFPNR